jgi:hypothetical protein
MKRPKRPKLTQAGNALNRAELDLLLHLLTLHHPTMDGFLSYFFKRKLLSEDRGRAFLGRMIGKLSMQHLFNYENKNPKTERQDK